MQRERINEILGLVLFAFGVFLLISFFTFNEADLSFYTSDPNQPIQNACGVLGAYAAFGVFFTFGYSGYLIPLVFLFWSVCVFTQKVPEKLFPKVLGFFGLQFSIACLLALLYQAEKGFQVGGIVGYSISNFLFKYFGFSGTFIYSVIFLLVSFLLVTEFLLYEVFSRMVQAVMSFFENIQAFGDWLKEKFVFKKKDSKPKKLRITLKETKDKGNDKENLTHPLEHVELKIKKYEDQIKRSNKKSNKPLDEKQQEVLVDLDSKSLKKASKKAAVNDEEEDFEEDEEEYEEYEEVDEEDEEEEDEEEEYEDEEDSYEEEDDEEEAGEEDEEEYDGELEEEALEEDGQPSFKFVSVGVFNDMVQSVKLPDHSLLNDAVIEEVMQDDLRANSRLIENKFKDFNIPVKVMEVEQGPVITRYEIMPAPGIKLSRITNLQDDIALTMKTPSIRIAPVPGKSTIGIEVANSVSNTVFLKDLLENSPPKSEKYALPLFLGKDTSGHPLISDLSEMPHLLIAGTTGSGKTVCINAIITGLLYRLNTEQLRMVMIDPKMVELSVYNDIPHLAAPVVTDAKKAASVLNWVVTEMENRYKLLAFVGVRNIKSFNQRHKNANEREQGVPDSLPYIVVIVDELADLMMVASDKIESMIARLAQLSRAVGIHLILATQRPSVDVITGVIKANFPSRISFKVASKVDSRTVLDMMGADKLLGKGDMLFMAPGNSKPLRSQSAFITDDETRKITSFLKNQGEPNYLKELKAITSGKVEAHMLEKDEMYDEAVKVVLETGQASVSVLQRKLRLGYARAARIVDMMEAHGIVGPYQGSKPREILVSREQI